MLIELEKSLLKVSNSSKAEFNKKFFKTKEGEYGFGDKFIGISVPKIRNIAKEFLNLSFDDIKILLEDKVHEKRLIGLLILVENYKKSKEDKKKMIFEFYLENRKSVNNWDLVDLTADKIVGDFLLGKDKEILYILARSERLWERRIAIVSTFTFIKQNQFDDTIHLFELLINDREDLIHKAVGWMLREIGKRNVTVLENILKKNYKKMPRTMLRYAIEKFDKDKRKRYLRGNI